MIPVQSEHVCSIQRALKCVRRELKLYLFTEVLCHTSRFSSKFRLCVKMLQAVAQRKSMNACSEVK